MKEYTCPHCQKPIYDQDALLCHFCGESLGKSSSGFMGTLRGAGKRYFAAIIAIVVIVSFLIVMVR